MAFRRLPRPLPPAHRGDRYPTRRQAGQHGACLGRSGRTPPVSIGMGGPRCSTITRRPCLFSAVCAAVAPDRPLCFPQMRAHKPCFRRPLVPQNHPPRAPDKHRHSRNTRTCGSQEVDDVDSHSGTSRFLLKPSQRPGFHPNMNHVRFHSKTTFLSNSDRLVDMIPVVDRIRRRRIITLNDDTMWALRAA